jgi:vitamin B12 transporter
VKTRSILLAVCVLAADAGHAETDEIIVTASRHPESADEALTSVTVIDREQILRQQSRTLPDILAGTAGLAVSNTGGLGKQSSVFLRGTESNHVLLLVDGVRIGSATTGLSAIEQIPLEQIERIEIVRGPRSSLYGSEAIGGVIQIFTRRGGGEPLPSLRLGAGSHGYGQISLGLSGGGERGWYNLSLSKERDEGFNSCSGDPVSFSGCATIEPDRDGFANLSGNLRAGYRFDNAAEIDIHWLHSDGETEFDGSFQNRSNFRQDVYGAGLNLDINPLWQVKLKAGHSREATDSFKDTAFASDFQSSRTSYSWLNEFSLGEDQQLSLGLDHLRDQVDSGTTAYTVDSRDNTGWFGQYRGQFGAHSMQLSLRRDHNQQFGDQDTGSIAWGYVFDNDLQWMASYGSAFVAPSFNDLYWPADPVWGGGGNPDLLPEESQSAELGISGPLGDGQWSVNLYQTQIDNLIGLGPTWAPENISKAQISGLEATINTRVAEWQLGVNLSLLDPQDRSGGANHGKQLPRRAQRMLALDAERSFGRLSLGAHLMAEGDRFDDAANRRKLAAYAKLDLRAGVQLGRDLLLQGRVENLLDQDYETASHYNQPGRSLFVSLNYRPGSDR